MRTGHGRSVPTQPKRPDVVSPALKQKIERALQKDRLPNFPSGGSASGSFPGVGMNEAFSLIAGKLDQMDNKLGKLDEMVTFHQLQTMKADLIAQFESHMKLIEAKHLQLENTNLELRSRVESLEQKVKSFSSSPQPDNAHKRISFMGFEGMSALDRIKFVSAWMSSNFAGVSWEYPTWPYEQ